MKREVGKAAQSEGNCKFASLKHSNNMVWAWLKYNSEKFVQYIIFFKFSKFVQSIISFKGKPPLKKVPKS